jgi:uncharacterized protein YpmS
MIYQKESMDEMSWKQRAVVLLSILAMILIGFAINQAQAGEQTRFYGRDGRTIGTATTSHTAKSGRVLAATCAPEEPA